MPYVWENGKKLEIDHVVSDFNLIKNSVSVGQEVALVCPTAACVMNAFSTLDGHAGAIYFLHEEVNDEHGEWHLLGENSKSIDQIYISNGDRVDKRPEFETDWVVYTSGTTGTPKATRHSLRSLSRSIKVGKQKNTWGLIYEPYRMAGIQVILQALHSRESLFIPETQLSFAKKIQQMVDNGVTALSATPTVWRNILQLHCTRSWDLSQVTLGGEIANQSIIDSLKSRFPNARVTHIFASTETGAAFSVNDGRSGFPVKFLEEGPNGMKIEIRNGVLFIQNFESNQSGSDGFVNTGDLVELKKDRVYFIGRLSGSVNIGGINVLPEQVEEVIARHPRVAQVSVRSVPNSISGNMLIAKVVITGVEDPVSFQAELRRWVREQSSKVFVPAKVEVVNSIPFANSGKLIR